MKIPRLLLLANLAGAAGLFAGDQDLTVGIDQMALDGKGRILSFSKAWSDKLIAFDNGQWKEVPVSLSGKPSQPRGLLGLRDGRVASVWNTGQNEWVLAVLDGNRISQKVPFTWSLGSLDYFEMTEDSSGHVWLSGGLPEVVRCEPSTGTARAFDLAPFSSTPSNKNWGAVFLTEDPRGGLWLWTSNQSATFSGLFRVHGDTLEYLADIPGYTGRAILDLRVRDKDSLWMATRDDGIFILNLETLSAASVSEPEKDAFHSCIGIFAFGNRWLVLSGVGSRRSLWQFDEGNWTRRTLPGGFHCIWWKRPTPAYLEVKYGALLAADNGLLFVPHGNKPAQLIDWRNGWPLRGVVQFLSLGGDRFAALSRGVSPRWVAGDLRDYLVPRPQPDAVEILPWRGWTVDGRDRIFTLLDQKSDALSVWENGSWRKIPLPKGLKADQLSYVELDSESRLWVFSDAINLPVGILHTDLKTWELQPDYPSALVKHCADLNGFAENLYDLRPITGPRGQIAFRTRNWRIVHWDGQAWKTWQKQDIGSGSKDDWVSTPFFDDAGHLCVNMHPAITSKLGEDQKWTKAAYMPGIPDVFTGTKNIPGREDRKLPDDFGVRDIQRPWVATDNLGMKWVAGNSNLYKYHNGRTIAVFDGKTVHPFLKNPEIFSVRVDQFGNTWLQLGDSYNHILLPARKSKPSILSVKVDPWGLAELTPAPEGTIEWHLNRGDWETLRAGEQSLGFVPQGDHEVEFRIFTDRLDLIGPITKKISVAVNSSEQIDHFIAILRAGPDRMREIAVNALAGQPSRAIPALKAAIASDDFWWLQAALQECEHRPVKGGLAH